MVNIASLSFYGLARSSYQSLSVSAVSGAGGMPSIRMGGKSLIQPPPSGSRSSRKGPSATRSPTTFGTGASLLCVLFFSAIVSLRLPLMPNARCLVLPVQPRLLVRGKQEAHEDERLEPGDVRVEPVVDGELECDDDRRRERGQAPDGAPAGHEGDEHGEKDGEGDERPLQEREGRHLGEDRPRAHPLSLEAQGSLVEELRGLDGLAGEEQDGEGHEEDAEAAEHVVDDRAPPPAVVGEPEGAQDQGEQLHREPGGDGGAAGERRGGRRE